MERPTRPLLLALLWPAQAACSAHAPTGAAAPTAALVRMPSSDPSPVAAAPEALGVEDAASNDLDSPIDSETNSEVAAADAALDDPTRCEGPDIDTEAAEASGPSARSARRQHGETTDALDASTIRNVVRRHSDGFMGCYQLGLGRDPKLQGRVTTRFAIDPGGKISTLTIAANDLPDCSVVECIRDHFVTIEFPPPGSVVTVQYPLVFGHLDAPTRARATRR